MKFLLLNLTFLIPPPLFSAATSIEVFSRSIMPNCQYVYAAEADVFIEINSNEGIKKVKIYIEDAWKKHPELLLSFPRINPGENKIEFSYQLMDRGLYRKAKIVLSNAQDQDFIFYSDFGREFREACYTKRFSKKQFRKRRVEAQK